MKTPRLISSRYPLLVARADGKIFNNEEVEQASGFKAID
jgi:hypothetical protein